MSDDNLCKIAIEAMNNAYAPYSHCKVGAALLAKSGEIYTGCNVENASYTPTICAERNAIFNAVNNKEREFVAIAVAGGHEGILQGGFTPCGVCRQVMSEFCTPDFKILVVTDKDSFKEYSLGELLPEAFLL